MWLFDTIKDNVVNSTWWKIINTGLNHLWDNLSVWIWWTKSLVNQGANLASWWAGMLWQQDTKQNIKKIQNITTSTLDKVTPNPALSKLWETATDIGWMIYWPSKINLFKKAWLLKTPINRIAKWNAVSTTSRGQTFWFNENKDTWKNEFNPTTAVLDTIGWYTWPIARTTSKIPEVVSEAPKYLGKKWYEQIFTAAKLDKTADKLHLWEDKYLNKDATIQWLADKWVGKNYKEDLSKIADNTIDTRNTLLSTVDDVKWVYTSPEIKNAQISLSKMLGKDATAEMKSLTTKKTLLPSEVDKLKALLWKHIFSEWAPKFDSIAQQNWKALASHLDKTIPWYTKLNKDIQTAITLGGASKYSWWPTLNSIDFMTRAYNPSFIWAQLWVKLRKNPSFWAWVGKKFIWKPWEISRYTQNSPASVVSRQPIMEETALARKQAQTKLLPQGKVITPQTSEKWVIQESKKWLENSIIWTTKTKPMKSEVVKQVKKADAINTKQSFLDNLSAKYPWKEDTTKFSSTNSSLVPKKKK